ncbi:MAG: PilZ domain-containing protein [Rhizobiales bacterium]|nr:PilZ domain-containing protein [Hyphomicrobiales bacterium]
MPKAGPARAERSRPRAGEHEPRQARRKDLRYRVAIETIEDGQRSPCLIQDISETGARLRLDDDVALPERFLLRLAENRPQSRLCRLVWRDGPALGVAFID